MSKDYFDNWKMHLHQEKKTVSFVKQYNSHYLLEKNFNTHSKELFSEKMKIVNKDKSQQTLTLEIFDNILNRDLIPLIIKI